MILELPFVQREHITKKQTPSQTVDMTDLISKQTKITRTGAKISKKELTLFTLEKGYPIDF